MRTFKTWMAAGLMGCAATLGVRAQDVQGFVHEQSDASGYVWPEDRQVREKLAEWQDQKFGVLFHWGLYSVPGIVESWSICSEDEEWIPRDTTMSYDEYKRWYWGLKDRFNPTGFAPEQWAAVMKDAGMRYMIFTTKHHDGFCMYDSKYTDFSIARGPFRTNARRDVARHVFDAFRDAGFMVGAYFSKPDWHCPWYWHPYFATPTRRHNYKKERHPDWWQRYQTFTENQLLELTAGYGPFDILWLDGGWVTGEDVHLDNVLARARQTSPGLISVDRTIRGRNENYQTPERSIPDRQLSYPWESCLTLSNDWGWTPNAPYKAPERVIAALVEVTAKGGCLLLGVGPTPEGTIEQPVVERLHRVGEWLRQNGEAIYATRPTPHYRDGRVWFTAHKDGRTLYAIYTVEEGETLPAEVSWTKNLPKGKMYLLQTGKRVKYALDGDRVTVSLPQGLRSESLVFRFEVE